MASQRFISEFERMLPEMEPGLRAFLSRRLGNSDDADDALQEILYNLFRTAGSDLAGIVNIPAWLYRSARNMIANILRRPLPQTLDDDDLIASLLAEERSAQEDHMLQQMFWTELEHALAELPESQRSVWEMTELEGIQVKEIAEMTGIPQATLLSRKHYAVKHLRIRLKQLYEDIINR